MTTDKKQVDILIEQLRSIDPAADAVGLGGNNKSYLLSVNAEVMSPIIRSGIPPPLPTLPIVNTAASSNNIDTDCRSR